MEALPSPPLDLDILGLEERIQAAGWEPLVNAGVLLIAKKDQEATIYQTGKVVVKNRDEGVARRVWNELAPHLAAVDRVRS